MARAKRTAKAEARRRYRAYLAELEHENAEDGEIDEADRGSARSRADDDKAAPRPGQRMGVLAALRGATRPVNYVADLRYAPQLITGTRAVWLPSAAVIASAAFVIWRVSGLSIEEARQDTLIEMTVMFMLSPYMMLPGLMAGFLAPRASWLAGALVAIVTTIAFGAVVGARPELFDESRTSLGGSDLFWTTVTLMTLSVPMGVLLAAFSAWYKRFLDLIGQNSGRRAAAQKQARRKSARQPLRRSR